MLLLLSSSARRRYRDDIVRALAHPAGTELRFRYGTEYVDASVLANVKAKLLDGREALICHLADQPDGKPALIIPCRFATIARAQIVGTSIILTLSASAYVQRLSDRELRSLMSADELARLPNQGSDAQSPHGKFAFAITAPLTSNAAPDAAGMAAFESTAKALRAAGFGTGDSPMAFYAVRDLVEIKGKLGETDPINRVTQGRYLLNSGARYALDVYSYAPDGDVKPADTSTLSIEADDGDVKFSSETAAKLDSRYDLHRFRFTVEQRMSTLQTGLRLMLGVPVVVDGKTLSEERCDVTLELRFASSNWLALGRIVVIGVSTAGPALIAAVVRPEWSPWLGLAMLVPAFVAAYATVFPNFKKS